MNILFIETGVSGGGSFASLNIHLKLLSQNQIIPYIVCFNYTHYFELWKERGYEVFLLDNIILTKKNYYVLKKIIIKIYPKLLRLNCYISVIALKIYHRKLIHNLVDIVNKYNIDLIHLNVNIERDIFGILISQKFGIKTISHLRSTRCKKLNPYLIKLINKFIFQFIANSHFTKEHWGNLGININKIEVVRNPILAERTSRMNVRGKYYIPKNIKYIVGCVANFLPYKGHFFLLDTIKHLLIKNQNISLSYG
jgi:glycosyltransferase involved in cell wall biosynthesis